jgi:molybdate transport system ATP-binding protein
LDRAHRIVDGRIVTVHARIRRQLGSLALDADLEIKPGEVVALLGPNGAGKSTLVRCLAGLEPIDDGNITIDDVVVDDPSRGVFVAPEQRPVGCVFQDHLLFEHMSVLENVAFGLRARGTAQRSARQTASEWLDRVGLSDFARHRPRALSGGQAQRIALARALATNPRVLLLDEPLAALDAAARNDVRRELLAHLDSFAGMRLLVTHDPVDAYALADRVVILDGGLVVQTGSLSDVAAHPKSRFVAELVGVNLIRGVVEQGVLITTSGARVTIADAPPGESFAMIRPHSVTVARRAPSDVSTRNAWPGTVASIDRLGERVRVGIDGELPLTAEVTVDALEALGLRLGEPVYAAVKATDIEVYSA